MPTFVIVGAGHAGGRAAEAMRKHGFDGRVVLIGTEPHLPHERPPLSKGALLGTQDYESCLLHQRAFYDEQAIELSLGAGVAAVDCAAATLSLGDGRIFGYDKLLFTTGATPRRLGRPAPTCPASTTCAPSKTQPPSRRPSASGRASPSSAVGSSALRWPQPPASAVARSRWWRRPIA